MGFFFNTCLLNAKQSQLVFTTHIREFLSDTNLYRDDAVWYIEKVRTHYPCSRLREVRIEPGLKQELRKQPRMEKYEKKEDYYNKVL